MVAFDYFLRKQCIWSRCTVFSNSCRTIWTYFLCVVRLLFDENYGFSSVKGSLLYKSGFCSRKHGVGYSFSKSRLPLRFALGVPSHNPSRVIFILVFARFGLLWKAGDRNEARTKMVGGAVKGDTSRHRIGEDSRGPRPLRTTPTILQGNVHLAIGKALFTMFLPDTPSDAPTATCVLRQTFYLIYFFRQRHVSSKIVGRTMRGNIF